MKIKTETKKQKRLAKQFRTSLVRAITEVNLWLKKANYILGVEKRNREWVKKGGD